jgi:hypothetical protein
MNTSTVETTRIVILDLDLNEALWGAPRPRPRTAPRRAILGTPEFGE